ncbi:hypothetical protein [Leptospira adleri]|uniref:hypothetical protein n=1 Tax=Leptospira adleri TaxID=2023186 RepID=UPI00108340F4|nr:hypothetical protein [Leptospira adleri]TGM53375.1 hypothetical protein EHQ97_15985 [Leptospira adleri]
MKFLFYTNVFVALILFSEILFAGIQAPPIERKPKNKDQIKRIRCCQIEKQYEDSVVLESICLERDRTVVNFRYLFSNTICSYGDRLEMRDSNSNRYRSLGMNQIQECPKLSNVPKGHRFQWYFEPMEGKPEFVDITEDLNADPLTPNWRWWHWEKINMAQCHLKQ